MVMFQESIQFWLSLQMIQGIGPVTQKRLLGRFGSPEAVLNASYADISALDWISERTKSHLLKGPDEKAVKGCTEKLEALGAWVMPINDSLYPSMLKEIHDPPILLYGLGDPKCLNNKGVSIVGSRRATTYGMKVAKELASGLVLHGFSIISGLAPGIDTASHLAAVEGSGCTIAVKGCGLDVPYPKENQGLARRIQGKGAVITEFIPGTQPEPYNFPRRNRIISGLSLGVVVVEGGEKSGSSITARCALDQNRSVMAVPGSIYSYNSKRPHMLIKEGAKLVETAKDIIQELSYMDAEFKSTSSKAVDLLSSLMSSDEIKIYENLGPYPVHIDDLVQITGMAVAIVNSTLLQMELKDLVQALPGQMYQRK